jgi:hypothetical protein
MDNIKKTEGSKKKWIKPEVYVMKINSDTASSTMNKAVETLMMGMLQPS